MKKKEVKEVKQIEEKKEKVEEIKAEPVKKEKVKKPSKIGKYIKPIACVLVVLLSLLGILYFTGMPKAVAVRAVDRVYNDARNDLKEIERLWKKYDFKKPMKMTYSMKFETDYEDLKELDGLKFSGTAGFDAEQKLMVAEAELKHDESFEVAMAVKGKKPYVKLLDTVIDVSDSNNFDVEDLSYFYDLLLDFEPDFKSGQQILKSFRDAVVKGIDEDALERTTDTLSVNGKEVKVNVVTYKLDKKSSKYFLKTFAKTLKDDKKFLKAIDKLADNMDLDFDADDVKDGLDELIEEANDIEIEKDEVVTIQLYSKGLFNEVVGFKVKEGKEELIEYYSHKGNTELVINDSSEGKIVLSGVKEGKKTNYTLKVDKTKVAKFTVRAWDKDKVDLDFTIYANNFGVDGQEVSGTIYVTAKEGKHDITGEYKVSYKSEDGKFAVSGDYSIEFNAKDVEAFSTKDAVEMLDVDWKELKAKVNEKYSDDEIIKEEALSVVNDLESSGAVYNYNNMIEVEEDEAIKLLKRTRPTVLFYASYYDYRRNNSDYSQLSTLKELQKELDFHSYYLDNYYGNYDFDEEVKDVEYTCSSEECDETPAIYLIKDGKVVKAFRGTVDKETLKAALEEIGI